jgi:putative flavoprotein involved in K+ transport
VTLDAIVIGAGPAGLATSRELARRNVRHVVLERGDRLGHTWANLYDSLVLHTGKHLSSLPGLRFPRATPLFPPRRDFLDYLDRYATTFNLPIDTGADVIRAERAADGWRLQTRAGAELRARSLVAATGIVANPHVPALAGRDRFAGRVRHSVEYRRPADIPGPRVLVVGVGNSAGEIAAELANAGRDVTLAVRSGAFAVPLTVAGVPIQYVSIAYGYLPRPAQRGLATLIGRLAALRRGKGVLPPPNPGGCPKVPLIGFHLTSHLRAGTIRLQRGIASFTASGVRFDDGAEQPFDDVILATGYRAAVGLFGDQINVDDCGFGRRRRRVVSEDQPDLYYVGHNPDVRGGLFSISRDAKRTAKLIAEGLR